MVERTFVPRQVWLLVALAAILGITFWYGNQNKRAGPTFDPAKQFVPEGAESRDVDQSLAAFGFTKPLPFFDERNVMESLNAPSVNVNALVPAGTVVSFHPATSTPLTPLLSYYVYGQSAAAVRDAFTDYFNALGWKKINSIANGPISRFVFVAPDTHKRVATTILEISLSGRRPQSSIAVSLSLQSADIKK